MAEHGQGVLHSLTTGGPINMRSSEAIPYNAALMDQMGVVTAINSDDAEMA